MIQTLSTLSWPGNGDDTPLGTVGTEDCVWYVCVCVCMSVSECVCVCVCVCV